MSRKGLLATLVECMNDVQNEVYQTSKAAKMASGAVGVNEVGNNEIEMLVAKTEILNPGDKFTNLNGIYGYAQNKISMHHSFNDYKLFRR